MRQRSAQIHDMEMVSVYERNEVPPGEEDCVVPQEDCYPFGDKAYLERMRRGIYAMYSREGWLRRRLRVRKPGCRGLGAEKLSEKSAARQRDKLPEGPKMPSERLDFSITSLQIRT